ncbi:unnamed protein product [Prunus armeniaca]|uniref:RING-type E3 ubiquitin transferase n=1 Tax=Prunus armeniaca TaxID=36596 RepID=A0A6J5YC10_PRUAR|nr:unnamed protein product [Prunus armeniaca]
MLQDSIAAQIEQHKMVQDGVLWCLGGGALFLLGCYNDRQLYFLERIKNMDKDEDKDRDDIWMKTHKLLNSTTQEVPRYLVRIYSLSLSLSLSQPWCVHLVGAQSASGFYCPAENAVFKGSKKSWPGIETVADLENLPSITKGSLESNELSVYFQLAVKDGNGTISIRAPDGGPFYVSPHTIDQLTGDSRIWASFCYFAAFGLTVYGAVQTAKHSI